MKYAVVLVVAAVILPGLEAVAINSQSEEAVLDRWLSDLAERQSFQEEEEDTQDATPTEGGVEGYLAEFFSPKEDKQSETFDEEDAESEDEVGNYFANFQNFDPDSAHFDDEVAAVSEDEVDSYFDNFADFFDLDSEMAHVEISEECSGLRARVMEKEKMVRDTEIALDEHEVRLRKALNILKAEKDRSCDRECKLICVGAPKMDSCASKTWGTCVPKVVWNKCAKKIRDPACVALETACKKKKAMAAANAKAAQAKRDETRNKLRALEKELKDLAESASNKGCEAEATVDCKEWDKRMTDAVKRVAKLVAVVAVNQGRFAAATAAENSAKNKNCNLNCKEVCVPGAVRSECTAKAWGRCLGHTLKWNSCARKVIDQDCVDLEEECKKMKVSAAAKVLIAEKALKASKAKFQEARDDANTVKANVPQECKKGQE